MKKELKRKLSLLLALIILVGNMPIYALEGVVERINEKEDLNNFGLENDVQTIEETLENQEDLIVDNINTNYTEYDLDELIEETKIWSVENNDDYDVEDAIVLLLLGEPKDKIISKKMKFEPHFGYKGKPNNLIINKILGTEAKEGYLEELQEFDFESGSNSSNDIESKIYSILAMEILGLDYDSNKVAEILLNEIKTNKITNNYKGQAILSIVDKIDDESKLELIEIIYDLEKDGLIGGNLDTHVSMMQALISLGEDTDSDRFKMMFETVLKCKKNNGYSRTPAMEYSKAGTEIKVLQLLWSMKNSQDIYSGVMGLGNVEDKYSIKIDNSKVKFFTNEKLELEVIVKNNDEIVKLPYTFKSSDENIVKVVDNKFEIIKEGKVNLTVQLDSMSNILDVIEIEILKSKELETINKNIENLLNYYEKNRVKDYSNELGFELYTILAKTDADLSKWKKSDETGKGLDTLASRAQQIELTISLDKDPRKFKDSIDLIAMIEEDLKSGIKTERFSQNYLDAVNAYNRYNILFDEEPTTEMKEVIVENLLYAMTITGDGFGGGPRDKKAAIPNTGRGLRALSQYKDIDGVDKAIESSVKYLKNQMKNDGKIYDAKYFATNHIDAVKGLLAVGENLTKDNWKINEVGPIEAMLSYKNENGSIKQQETSTIESDKIATREALNTLIMLEDMGYGSYELFGESIVPEEELKPSEKYLKDYLDAVVKYYDDVHFVENQSTLSADEYVTLKRLNNDLAKWTKIETKALKYDIELNLIGNKADQIEIYLGIDKDPKNYKGRNLIEEILVQINEGADAHPKRSYLKALRVIQLYNKKYPQDYIELKNDDIVNNILSMQNQEGGFVERGNIATVENTGLALEVLSELSGSKANESINKALDYLKSIQKEDGTFYISTFYTVNHVQAMKGLLAVGEDFRTEEWKQGNNGPIEGLFTNWQKNNSFWNTANESINNRPWITATEKGLSVLIDLSEKGYSKYVLDSIPIHDKEKVVPEFLEVETAVVFKTTDGYEKMYLPSMIEIDTSKHGDFTPLGALKATTPIIEETAGYVSSIGGLEARGMDGWVYRVNDMDPGVYANRYKLKAGDRVLWYYAKASDNYMVPTWMELEKGIKIDIDYKSELKVGDKLVINPKIYNQDGNEIEENFTLTTDNLDMFKINGNEIEVLSKGSGFGQINLVFESLGIKTLNFTIKEDKETNKNRLDLDETIIAIREELISKNELDFRASIGYNNTSKNIEADLKKINDKFVLRNNNSVANIAGNIIGIIGAGGNPYNYKNENYVNKLVILQSESGLFGDIKEDNFADIQSFAIYALEMTDANYNRDKALENFLSYSKENYGGTDSSANALVTLSFFDKNDKVIKEIDKIKIYLKENQKNNGGIYNSFTGENLHSTFATIQGLIAVGEDVESDNWSVNGNSLVDYVLKNNIEDLLELEFGLDQALLALGDIKYNSSVYNRLKLNKEEPVKIKLKEQKLESFEVGMKFLLEAEIYDIENNELFGYEVEWSLSNDNAELEGNSIELLKEGSVKIKGKIKGFESVSVEKEIEIVKSKFDIEIVKKTGIVNGEEASVSANLKNNQDIDQNVVFIVGLYDDNNKLVNYSYVEKLIKSHNQETLGAGFKVPMSGNFTIKVFVWDSFANQNIILQDPVIVK